MSRSLRDDSLRPTRGQGADGELVPGRNQRDSRAQHGRTAYPLRGRNYHLNSNQAAMLQDVGAFRTITADSLRRHLYQGDEERFKKDLTNLTDQRLVAVQQESKGKDRYISLTREGKGVTESHLRTNSNQAVYSGIVKKRELRHDAAIYDVYQKEAQKISKSGGTPKRVVLDFELKKNVNRQLSKIQNLPSAARERQRKEIADAHELQIVNGKIQFPDVRVEYDSREQEQCKVDLECVTGHLQGMPDRGQNGRWIHLQPGLSRKVCRARGRFSWRGDFFMNIPPERINAVPRPN
jgi:hypothetical protein